MKLIAIILFLLPQILLAQTTIFTDDSSMDLQKVEPGDIFPSIIGGLNNPSLNLGIAYDLKLDVGAGLLFQCGGSVTSSDVTSTILSTSLIDEVTIPVITDSLVVVQGIDIDREARQLYFIDGDLEDIFLGRICRVDYDGSDQQCLVEFEFKSPLSGGGCKLALDNENNEVYFINGGFAISRANLETGIIDRLNVPDDTFMADLVLDTVNNRLVYLRGTPSTTYFLYEYDLNDPNATETLITTQELEDSKSIFLDYDRDRIVIGRQSFVNGVYTVSMDGSSVGDILLLNILPTADIVFFNVEDIGMTSTENVSFETNITLFPNPASDLLHIEGLTNDILEISILDVMGNRVMSTQDNISTLNISALESGIYLLQVQPFANPYYYHQ